jgi:outer membrane lipoprotein-sorting protein
MKRIPGFFLALILGTGMGWCQTGFEIVQMADNRKEPADISADLTMVLTNAKGKTRTSTIRSVSIRGGEKQIIWFLAPPDDKGVAFLKIEHPGSDDEMRLWLPAFKKVRRISSAKKGDSFMGSDLSYEDMTNRELDEYTYRRLPDDTVEGRECYVVEATPKPEAKSTYSKHVTWITKDGLLVVQEESYDRSGRLLKKKQMKYRKLKGYDVPVEIFVENVQKNHSTRLTFDNIEVDTGVQENLFQEKNLKRLPR